MTDEIKPGTHRIRSTSDATIYRRSLLRGGTEARFAAHQRIAAGGEVDAPATDPDARSSGRVRLRFVNRGRRIRINP